MRRRGLKRGRKSNANEVESGMLSWVVGRGAREGGGGVEARMG